MLDGELGDTGWTKLPNGLILQWGIIHAPYTSSSIIVFPKEFPHKVLNVEVSMLGGIGSWGTQWIMSTGNWSSTSAYVTVIDNCNIPQISWFALGY